MAQSKPATEHEVTKEILQLTMLLKSKYPSLYAHLDETPIIDKGANDNKLKTLEDYRDTLLVQLMKEDAEKARIDSQK